MKEKIRIHLIPTYKIDYTTGYELYDYKNTTVGDLVKYDKLLEQLSHLYNIEQIIIDGGEISLLSDLYFDLLYKIVKLYTKNIKVCTNFKTINPALINGTDIITVKYNFTKDEEVFKNIKAAIQIGKIINIETLDVACKNETPNVIINQLNKLNIKSFEIIPYFLSAFSDISINCGYKIFEESVLTLLKYSNKMNFAFHNKLQLEGILQSDNYEIQNVYITPNNKYAIESYDNNQLFSLVEIDDITNLTKNLKKQKENQEEYCKACKIKLKCMANYNKCFNNSTDSCCGFSDLIYKYSTHKENN